MSELTSEMIEAGYLQACHYPAVALHASHNETRSMVETVYLAMRAADPDVKALVEAATPFAREAEDWPDMADCDDLPPDATDINVGDLRRLRTALRNISGGDDE